jgi:hypothetical protein
MRRPEFQEPKFPHCANEKVKLYFPKR